MNDSDEFSGDDLLDAARLGLDVQHFQKTPGGLALVELAMADLNESLMALLDEPDLSSAKARQAHAKARTARGVMNYMRECVNAGKDAERQLNEDDDHE